MRGTLCYYKRVKKKGANMTAKELYEWAKKEKLENAPLVYVEGISMLVPVGWAKGEYNKKRGRTEIVLYEDD